MKLPMFVKAIIGKIGYLAFQIYLKSNRKQIKVLNEDETVAYIIKNNSSVARFGDGELLWMLEKRQEGNFEKNSPELAQHLRQVLNENSKKLLICLPNVFNGLKGLKKVSRIYWQGFFIRHGKEVVNYIDSSKIYGDTQFTRPYMDYLKNRDFEAKFKNLKRIWQNRDLLIIEGEKSRFGVGNNLLDNASSIKRILCPSVNAFESYEQIKKWSENFAIENKNVLVLVSLGPTATVLVSDLSNINIQAIDIGHLDVEYQWFKMNATEKVPVPGKYVNESKEKFELDLPKKELKEYQSQIIKIIH